MADRTRSLLEIPPKCPQRRTETKETRQKRAADSPVGLIAEMLCAIAADKRAKDAGRCGRCEKILPVDRGGRLTQAVRDPLASEI